MENKIGKLVWEQIYRAFNARWWNVGSILQTMGPTEGECRIQHVLKGCVGLNWEGECLEVRTPTLGSFLQQSNKKLPRFSGKNSLKQGLKFWYIIWEVPTQASKAKEKGKRARIWSNAKWCLTELASALCWATKRHSESLSRSDLWHMRLLEMGYKEKAGL